MFHDNKCGLTGFVSNFIIHEVYYNLCIFNCLYLIAAIFDDLLLV
jgi:hypothetical protein